MSKDSSNFPYKIQVSEEIWNSLWNEYLGECLQDDQRKMFRSREVESANPFRWCYIYHFRDEKDAIMFKLKHL